MKNIDEITTEVLNWVYEKFPLAKNNKISDNDSLLESGIVDSLGILDIVAFLEETFSIQLSDEDMVADHFETVHSIASFTHVKISGSNM